MTPARTKLITQLTELHHLLYNIKGSEQDRLEITPATDEDLAEWVEELVALAKDDALIISTIKESLIKGGH